MNETDYTNQLFSQVFAKYLKAACLIWQLQFGISQFVLKIQSPHMC